MRHNGRRAIWGNRMDSQRRIMAFTRRSRPLRYAGSADLRRLSRRTVLQPLCASGRDCRQTGTGLCGLLDGIRGGRRLAGCESIHGIGIGVPETGIARAGEADGEVSDEELLSRGAAQYKYEI